MNQLASGDYNAALEHMVGMCQRLLEEFASLRHSRQDTRTPEQIVRARKNTLEVGLRNFLAQTTPEIGVILDGVDTSTLPNHLFKAYWTIVSIDDPEKVALFLHRIRASRSHSGAFALALTVEGKVKCAAVGGVFSPWVVRLSAKIPPSIEDPHGSYNGLLALARASYFGEGEITFGNGGLNSELPYVLYSVVTAFKATRYVRETSYLGSLCRLWARESNVHIQPPGIDRPAIMAPVLAFNRSLDIVSLRLADDTLNEFEPTLQLTNAPRDYWTVTVRRSQLPQLSKLIRVVLLS